MRRTKSVHHKNIAQRAQLLRQACFIGFFADIDPNIFQQNNFRFRGWQTV